jgi:3-isopropylmalate/(R)-2-methylmalate dehydratase large subunit
MQIDTTMTERIFQRHCPQQPVRSGDIVFAEVDLVTATDAVLDIAVELERLGMGVKYPDRLAIVPDHHVPSENVKEANGAKAAREFARRFKNFIDVGRGGIGHLAIPEAGLCHPGDIIIGLDSHTCTYGAFSAFGTGMGGADAAIALATGKIWFRVPEAYKIVLSGQKGRYVQGKDIMLSLIAHIGVDGAIYKALEFCGPALPGLGISDRVTICNMAVETGAKAGFFEADEVTTAYFKDTHGYHIPEENLRAVGIDSAYGKVIAVDVSTLEPLVALPSLPSNVTPASQVRDARIDQAFIGSCNNGNIEDMRMAAEVLRGRRIAPGVRMIVLPGTQRVMKDMIREGLVGIFIDAGALVGPPTCGPCSGTHMGILAAGEACVSTTNRNFVGRMGSPESSVYLANPAVAAASAVKGEICDPREVMD